MPIPVWRLRDHDRTPRYANQPPGGPGILRGLSGAREQLPAAGAAAADDRNPPLPDYAARLARDLRRTMTGRRAAARRRGACTPRRPDFPAGAARRRAAA